MWHYSFKFFTMQKVYKSQLVEIVLAGVSGGNQSTRLQFLDQPYLRGKKITGIELITKYDMATYTSPTGRNIYSIADASAYVTFYLNDVQAPQNVGEWIQNVPLPLLHRSQNNQTETYVRKAYELAEQVIYWEKCFFTFPVPLANTSDISFLLNVYFKN